MNAREAAFLALQAHEQKGLFLDDIFSTYKLEELDQKLAYELACGTLRQRRLLDFCANLPKLPKKSKERILLRLTVYQLQCLSKIPPHAIGNEMVQLAKKYANSHFAAFLNAFVRNYVPKNIDAISDSQVRFSYPDFFVEKLREQYAADTVEQILRAGNKGVPLMVRSRTPPFQCHEITSRNERNNCYIQNKTQPTLYAQLSQHLKKRPQSILDLCAAPGGKTILLHDLFPDSHIVANDKAEWKVKQLSENLRTFNVAATITTMPGEHFETDERFDLIVVDAPCSNSGVFYKCPEARWRFTQEELTQLQATQTSLLLKAATLLREGGQIWYSTCSIVADENEKLVASFCKKTGLTTVDTPHTILPDGVEYEGGFACQLST